MPHKKNLHYRVYKGTFQKLLSGFCPLRGYQILVLGIEQKTGQSCKAMLLGHGDDWVWSKKISHNHTLYFLDTITLARARQLSNFLGVFFLLFVAVLVVLFICPC